VKEVDYFRKQVKVPFEEISKLLAVDLLLLEDLFVDKD